MKKPRDGLPCRSITILMLQAVKLSESVPAAERISMRAKRISTVKAAESAAFQYGKPIEG